jgi:hypothetical protein
MYTIIYFGTMYIHRTYPPILQGRWTFHRSMHSNEKRVQTLYSTSHHNRPIRMQHPLYRRQLVYHKMAIRR